MTEYLIGLSSWANPELIETGYYPPKVKTAEDRLRYYATQFKITEIDSSYHFFPTRHNLDLWLNATPEEFKFNFRAFSLFTNHPTAFKSLPATIRNKYGATIEAKNHIYLHHLSEEAISELWQIFINIIDYVKQKNKLGAVLFQFPPWFHPEPKNYEYIASCWQKLNGHRIAVEFRAQGWLDGHLEETLQFLREKQITLVCVDEPQGFKSSVPPILEITAPLSIIRFHGRNAENWERPDIPATAKYDYLYSEKELNDWTIKIQHASSPVQEIHIIFKNKHLDFPAQNAIQMKKLLNIT